MISLSIVIPTKNEERYLGRLLHSIEKQTFQPREVIVADAHSSDRTREIAYMHGAKVVDGGLPGIGRNNGAKVAEGEVILFLDADVELRKADFLEKAVTTFVKEKFDIATADVLPISKNRFDIVAHEVYNKFVHVMGRRFPHAAGFFIMVKKDLHERIGGFDETVVFCEDHDYAMRASKVGKFGFLMPLKIPVSTRRLDRDGRLRIAGKFILAEIHLRTIGPIRKNYFHYTFGHHHYVSKK